jgi:uncharacterized protein (TIGR00290 family)
VALLTTVSRDFDRISIHGVRRSLLHWQAERLELPVVEAGLSATASSEEWERAFETALLEAQSRFPGVSAIAFGDLFLQDVRDYRDRLLERLGWRGVYPLWREDTRDLARRFVKEGYRAVLTCVDNTQLDASFAGREFDVALLADLPGAVDWCGERGEFHTFVYAGPGIAPHIGVVRGEVVVREGRFVYCDLMLPG